MPNEVELKLLIDRAVLPRLLRHPLLKAHTRQKLPTQRLLSIYYDTPDLTLHRHKIAVRLRRVGRRWLQTVKTEGRVAAGLHERPEWEYETEENTLNFQPLTDPALREFLADLALRQTLQPLFVTEFSRARRLLSWPNGDTMEFALDQGEIRAEDRVEPLNEVELELQSGTPGRLFECALELQQVIPLRIGHISKAERGYRLATQASITPKKANPPVLAKDSLTSDAFLSIAHECLTHLQANEEGIVCGSVEPEFVHQMRVAARRFRSLLRIFSPLIEQERFQSIREELRWLMKEFDGARNWDVFVLHTLPFIRAAFPQQEGLDWLTTQATELRREANRRAREALLSQRYHTFLLTLGACLTTQAWRKRDTSDSTDVQEFSTLEFASRVLRKRHAKLKQRGSQLARLAPEERHAARIAAKKVRYAAEFFSSLFPGKRARKYIAALSRVQDLLGAMNDAATTTALMQFIEPVAHDAVQHHAKGLVLGWAAGTSEAQGQALEEAWNHFLDCQVFWS